ncbi:MAG: trypsin-like peptidase domain-containing protein [Pseudobacteriovorax sp.]|nr:trypsin-like peptidase domain-containing protein [Pseudobacteriovorax sp.]
MLVILTIIALATFLGHTAEARVYQSFADIAAKAIPGVVNIRTTQYIAGKHAMLDPYQFFLQGRLPRKTSTHSLGSGVVVGANGYVITNYHVVNGASVIEILLAKTKKKVRAEVIGLDKKTDLALLKTRGQLNARKLDFGNSDLTRVGDIVIAIGNPFGFSHTVTSGIISAKGRVIGTGPYDSFLQTDAPIHPGNSGGPLIDMASRVIGINSAVSSQGAGIGFAIPSNMVQQVIRDLKQYGKVVRPWIGIVGKNILTQDEINDQFDPNGIHGVLVENLIVDGPAYQAKLRIGDLILAIDRKKVFDLNQLQRELSKKKPGQKVSLRIYRRRHGFMQSHLRLAETPDARELPQEKDLF